MDGALLLLFLLLRPLVCVQSRHFCTLTTRGNTEGTSFPPSPSLLSVLMLHCSFATFISLACLHPALLLCDAHFACVPASNCVHSHEVKEGPSLPPFTYPAPCFISFLIPHYAFATLMLLARLH